MNGSIVVTPDPVGINTSMSESGALPELPVGLIVIRVYPTHGVMNAHDVPVERIPGILRDLANSQEQQKGS